MPTTLEYATRKRAKLCVSCGRTEPVSGKVQCQKCWKTDRERQKRQYDDRKTRGVCAICGYAGELATETMCSTCREYHRKKSHSYVLEKKGSSLEEFEALLAEQGGKCAICRGEEPGPWGTWRLDHNHKTGRVRGLLCFSCNVFLGHAKDSPRILKAAVHYLARSEDG